MHRVPSHHRSVQNIHRGMGTDAIAVESSRKVSTERGLSDGRELLQKDTDRGADRSVRFQRIPTVRSVSRNYISARVTRKKSYINTYFVDSTVRLVKLT